MASVLKDRNGWRIRFYDGDGARKQIRVPKANKATAQKIGRHVDELNTAKINGDTIDRQTAVWLSKIEKKLHDKLADAGLVERRVASSLGDFVKGYIRSRSDVKAGTVLNYEQVRINLVAHFGYEKAIRSITADDAQAFRRFLKDDEKLAENTIRRRCGRARQFFAAAIKARLIEQNPFDGMPVTVNGNPGKERFVSVEESEKILAKCPDAEWKLIFALCRWGGLRCPSEVLRLTWRDVLWDASQIVVSSTKTEHIKGHDKRVIPMFPELEGPLLDASELADDGAVYVINRYRCNSQNLRTQFNRIVTSAGVKPWPKPFQNLRSTRETELVETYPAHVACAWIGNSEAVARKHYLQVTDLHFQAAIQKVAPPVAPQTSEDTQDEEQTAPDAEQKTADFRG